MSTPVEDLISQWTIGANIDPAQTVRSKFDFSGAASRNYSLKNAEPRKFLQYEKQRVGINLGWTDDAEPQTEGRVRQWYFTKPRDAGEGPVRYGDVIAIGNGAHDAHYIHYAVRTWGINLDWSIVPVFEWKLLGGRIGSEVLTGDRLTIFNTRSEGEGEPLIFVDRDAGGDLGWPSTESWMEIATGVVREQAEKLVREAVVKLLTKS